MDQQEQIKALQEAFGDKGIKVFGIGEETRQVPVTPEGDAKRTSHGQSGQTVDATFVCVDFELSGKPGATYPFSAVDMVRDGAAKVLGLPDGTPVMAHLTK